MAIVQSVFPRMMGIPGVLAFPINPPSLGGGFGTPVQFVLLAESYDELPGRGRIMMAEAQKLGYLVNMDTDLKLNKPQLECASTATAPRASGVSVNEIGSVLQTLLGGREAGRFKRGNHQYDVMLQVPSAGRASPAVIEQLHVRGANGTGAARERGQGRGEGEPARAQPLQPRALGHVLGEPRPGVTIGKAHRGPASHRAREAAAQRSAPTLTASRASSQSRAAA
jgi:multidrug efflux pump subunit AcrB